MEDGLVKVVFLIDDILVVKVGVLVGDLIIYIDGEQVQGLMFNEVVEKMCGLVNIDIIVIIWCEGWVDFLDIIIICDIICIWLVCWCEEDDVGYVWVIQFNEQMFDGFQKGIEEMLVSIGDDKLKGYVVDLCNNLGGLLDQVIVVLDVFFDCGEIVLICGWEVDEIQRYNVWFGDLVGGKLVIIFVNGGLVLVLEIVVGVLQDYCWVMILGIWFFGKGFVQIIILLGVNGVIWLIIVCYYILLGNLIQVKGIVFDIEVLQELLEELVGCVDIWGEVGLCGYFEVEGEE